MESIVELKRKIKTWEQSFLEQHDRKPSKEDINEAPQHIKGYYKTYWKLKKSDEETSKFNQLDGVWSSDLNKSSQKTKHLDSINLLQKYGEKLKKSAFVKSPKSFCPVKYKVKPHAPDSFAKSKPTSDNDEYDLHADTKEASNSSVDFDIDLHNRFEPFKEITIQKAGINNLPLKISVLPSGNKICQKRSSHFGSNIDRGWLERCSQDSTDSQQESNFVAEVMPHVSSIEAKPVESFPTQVGISLVENSTNISLIPPCNNIQETKDHAKTRKRKRSEADYLDVNDMLKSAEDIKNSKICNYEESLEVNSFRNQSQGATEVINGNQKEDIELKSDGISSVENLHGDNHKPATAKKLRRSKEATEDVTVTSYQKNKEKHLQRKLAAGTINDNFVQVNLKKKMFCRGHRRINVKKMKWKKWKQLKKESSSEGKSSDSSACFKCGQIGHWARNCKSNTENLLPDYEEEEFEFTLPTLEEAENLCKGIKTSNDPGKSKLVKIYAKEPVKLVTDLLDDFSTQPSSSIQDNEDSRKIPPFYAHKYSPSDKPPKEVLCCLEKLGYSEFRSGQKEAIMRILHGESTLVVLPTGSGKSLCYQLPAYMYAQRSSCITLVISPLVSLMEDQVTGLASCVHAVCLHSGMTEVQRKAALESISLGKAQIVLVSPEAIIGGRRCLPKDLPPIAFACIDEIHCLSEWSHNFRPSYLQLYKVLTQQLQVQCILGLTATATSGTISDIKRLIQLSDCEESVVGCTDVPANIHLSVSCDKDKDEALLKLLKGERFSSCTSIIIYCIRRDETERLAVLIRTCLQDVNPPAVFSSVKGKKSKRLLSWDAEAYHAGLTASKRRSVQKRFMSGKLRVVVATVAFGMGLDKSDVRAVIHYNMPKSFESYVQEIGRAGRDGASAHCHLLLEQEGKDLCELKRHIYSNSADRHTIKKFVTKIFVKCKCKKLQHLSSCSEDEASIEQSEKCPKHEVAIPISNTVLDLDMKEENISTLLCYLELNDNHWVELLAPTYAFCTIRCYGGPNQMLSTIKKCPALAVSMALDKQEGREWAKSAQYQFHVIDVASHMGWNSGSLKRELKNLEWNDKQKKTGVIVEFSDLSFHFRAQGDLSNDELDNVVEFLYQKISRQEKMEIHKLNWLNSVFLKYSVPHYWMCCDEVDENRSNSIKSEVKKYFEKIDFSFDESNEDIICDVSSQDIRRHIQEFIHINHDQKFSGRAIARIFHGIGSPCYPAEVWGKVYRFWRSHLDIDFSVILRTANEELRKLR